MTSLALASALFFVSHTALIRSRFRRWAVTSLGEPKLGACFSLFSIGILFWMVVAYFEAPYVAVWDVGVETRWLALIVAISGISLVVLAFTQPLDTLPTQTNERPDPRHIGSTVTSLVRHQPVMTGFTLWAAAHVMANGHIAAIIFFGSFAVLAVLGIWSQNERRHDRQKSGSVPVTPDRAPPAVIAIIRGETPLQFGERLPLRTFLLALAIGAILLSHEAVIGRGPWPL